MTMLLIWGGLAVFICLLVAPLRALLGFLLKQTWVLVFGALAIVLAKTQDILKYVWKCHLCVIKNMMPRNVVLPSVARTKTTRRQD